MRREVQVVFSPTDFDGDGLSNEIEEQLFTDPNASDSNSDGESDFNNDFDNISPLVEL